MSREAGVNKNKEKFIKRFGLPPSAIFPKIRKIRSDKGRKVGKIFDEETQTFKRA